MKTWVCIILLSLVGSAVAQPAVGTTAFGTSFDQADNWKRCQVTSEEQRVFTFGQTNPDASAFTDLSIPPAREHLAVAVIDWDMRFDENHKENNFYLINTGG